jgi:hypothetical protein
MGEAMTAEYDPPKQKGRNEDTNKAILCCTISFFSLTSCILCFKILLLVYFKSIMYVILAYKMYMYFDRGCPSTVQDKPQGRGTGSLASSHSPYPIDASHSFKGTV